jgi:hypothetical protein
MKKARVAEARVLTITQAYWVFPDSVKAVQEAFVEAVALYGSKIWWDPKEVGK